MVVSGFAQIQAQLQYRASGCSMGLPVVVGTSRGWRQGLWVWGVGFRVKGLGLGVEPSGTRVKVARFGTALQSRGGALLSGF